MTASEMQIAPQPLGMSFHRRPVVYVSPFSHPTNEYLENLATWSRYPLAVTCSNPAEIWNCREHGFKRSLNMCFLNWFEDRILKRQQKPRLVELVVFLYKLAGDPDFRGSRSFGSDTTHRVHGQDVPEWFALHAVLRTDGTDELRRQSFTRNESLNAVTAGTILPHPLYEPNLDDRQMTASSGTLLVANRGPWSTQRKQTTRCHAGTMARRTYLCSSEANQSLPGYLEVLQSNHWRTRTWTCNPLSRNLSKDEFESALLKHCKAVYMSPIPATR